MATLLKKIYIYIYTYKEPEPRCKLKIWKTDVLNFNNSLLKYGHPTKKKIYIYIYIYIYINILRGKKDVTTFPDKPVS